MFELFEIAESFVGIEAERALGASCSVSEGTPWPEVKNNLKALL